MIWIKMAQYIRLRLSVDSTMTRCVLPVSSAELITLLTLEANWC